MTHCYNSAFSQALTSLFSLQDPVLAQEPGATLFPLPLCILLYVYLWYPHDLMVVSVMKKPGDIVAIMDWNLRTKKKKCVNI